MNIFEMSIAASVLIVAIVTIRAVALYRLPKKMFLCLWGIATLRLLVPVSIPLPFSIPADWAAPVSDLAANPGTYIPLDTMAAPDSLEATIPIALMIWLAGVCACALYFAISYFKSRKEFKTSLPVESEFIDRWLKEHPLWRPIQVRQTDRTKAPLTYGVFHPVILLPKRIDLTDETSLRYVLTHEYIHIRHFDALTKLVLTAAVCCHWFNPLVWVMYILANRDIELICDETVVKSYEPDGKSAYALTLIKLEEIKSRVAIVNYFSRNFVEERITAIMKTKKYTLPVMIVAFAIIAFATVAYAVSASEPADQTETDDNFVAGELGGQIYSDYTVIDADPDIVVGVVGAKGSTNSGVGELGSNVYSDFTIVEADPADIIGVETGSDIDEHKEIGDASAVGEMGSKVYSDYTVIDADPDLIVGNIIED